MRGRGKHTILFGLVTTLYWFSYYAYVPILSPYAKSMGASYKMVGLIAGSYGFAQMAVRLPMGVLSDTLRRRKAFVVAGLVLAVVSGLGLFASSDPFWLLVFRFLSGVGAAAWLAFTVLYASYFDPAEAPKAIGILNSLNFVGQMCGTFLGGIVAAASGQRTPFLLGAVGGAIGLAMSLATLEVRPTSKPRSAKDLLKVGADRHLLSVSGLGIAVQIVAYGTVYGFAPVAAKDLGATDFQLGILTTIATVPMAVSSALSGSWFAKKLGEAFTVSFGFAILAFSAIAVPFAHSVESLYISQGIGGFGRGLVLPLLMGISIKDVAAEKRGTAMGIFQAMYAFGMFIGPMIVGLIADTVGLTQGFWTLGLIGLVSAAATLGLLRVAPAAVKRAASSASSAS